MSQKKWHKPELVVLVRGRLEESVLCHCKRPDKGGGSWGQWSAGCQGGWDECWDNPKS